MSGILFLTSVAGRTPQLKSLAGGDLMPDNGNGKE